MLSYHNNPNIKKEILAQLKAHYDSDEIIKGVYWKDGKGCAVGCTIHGEDHLEYETRFGIPTILAKLEDAIFEGLPNELAKEWPLQFMEAIPVGVDLSNVWKQFVIWLLEDPIYGVIKFAKTEEEKKFIHAVVNANKKWGPNKINRKKWIALLEKAYDTHYSYATFGSPDFISISTIYDIAVAPDADIANKHAEYYATNCSANCIYTDIIYEHEESKAHEAQANKLIELLQQAKGD